MTKAFMIKILSSKIRYSNNRCAIYKAQIGLILSIKNSKCFDFSSHKKLTYVNQTIQKKLMLKCISPD